MTEGQPHAATNSTIWTVTKVLHWATRDFKARGFEDARLDAELLLGHALGLSRVQLVIQATRPLSLGELGVYRELIKRRRASEPVAYILGFREFYGLSMRVGPSVMIPRPDTECLVEVALHRTAHAHMFGRGLDLCTGSGCVAVALASRRPTWKLVGTDISEAALVLALENALRHGAAFNLNLLESDLFEALPKDSRFDLITANPPYIPSHELENLPETIRDFEPQIALHGGHDGLTLTRSIVDQAPYHLQAEGVLACEIGYGTAELVKSLFVARGFKDIQVTCDYAGHERVVSGAWPQLRP